MAVKLSKHGCQVVQSMAVKGMAGGSVQVMADQGSDCMTDQVAGQVAGQATAQLDDWLDD